VRAAHGSYYIQKRQIYMEEEEREKEIKKRKKN